jgi:hypothetical protein
MLAATLLSAPGVAVWPLVVGVWATCAALAWDGHRRAAGER